jgi:DNA primase
MAVTLDLKKRKLDKHKGKMSLEMFLKDVIGLKRMRHTSRNYIGLCPFHDDSHRSFGVQIDYPHKWGCLIPDCTKGSSLVTLTMKKFECSYQKAEEIVETHMGYIKRISETTLDIPYYDEDSDFTLAEDLLIEHSCGYYVHPYIESRGLTRETIHDLRVGYDRWEERVVFPIFDDEDRLINFVGRTIHKDVEPKYRIYEDVDRDTFMYGEHLLPENVPYLVVYEGLLETAYSHQIGIPYCVSLLGAFITKKHVERMLRYTDTIVLFLDNDRAGKATTLKAIDYIKECGGQVKVVRHLTRDKKLFKDLLDYKSHRTIKSMIKVALNRLEVIDVSS